VTAEKLAKQGVHFANTPAGGDTETELDSIFARIDKRMNLAKD